MPCTIDHTEQLPRKAIETLVDSQASFWRHRCAGCAYEMGRRDAQTTEENLRKRVRELTAENERLKQGRTG
jgi:coenzyme F420-reducing hydrogenase delta subunit